MISLAGALAAACFILGTLFTAGAAADAAAPPASNATDMGDRPAWMLTGDVLARQAPPAAPPATPPAGGSAATPAPGQPADPKQKPTYPHLQDDD